MRRIFKRSILLLLSFSILCTGCVKTQVSMVGRVDGVPGQSLDRVSRKGTYVAEWAKDETGELHVVPDSERVAVAGDRLGFQRLNNGKLVGQYNDVQVPLADVSPDAKYVVWVHTTTRKTQFGKEVGKASTGAKETFNYVLIGGVVVAILAFGLIYGACDSK